MEGTPEQVKVLDVRMVEVTFLLPLDEALKIGLIVLSTAAGAASCSATAKPTPAPVIKIDGIIWEWVLAKNKATNEVTSVSSLSRQVPRSN